MKTLDSIKQDWATCNKCELCKFDRKQVCFSDGPDDAKIMLIGEGPGKHENETGIPFCGPAGQLMTKILALVGIKRNDVYWTNCVRCHPPNNRVPTQEELDACKPLLMAEIERIKPKVIILTGATPLKTVLGCKGRMGDMAGQWAMFQGIPTVSIYHPAAVLHTQDRDPVTCAKYKRSIWKSVQEVRDFLQGKAIPEGVKVVVENQAELFE